VVNFTVPMLEYSDFVLIQRASDHPR
jgi:hypothetical protein